MSLQIRKRVETIWRDAVDVACDFLVHFLFSSVVVGAGF